MVNPFYGLALIGIGLSLGAPTLRAQATHQLPPRALILGVPFISWSEAASLDYANKDDLNPSLPASEGMVLKYWGQDFTVLKQEDQKVPGWTQRGAYGGSVDSLKADVSRGIPVIVCLAMTPIAHNPGPAAAAMMAMSDSTARDAVQRGGSASGVLGQMVALDTLRRWGKVVGTETLRESGFMACRVVIGYDDPRKVMILHDPSFGPAWELSYADFENMWSFWNRLYVAMYPNDFARVLAKRAAAPPYPARTAAQHAASRGVRAGTRLRRSAGALRPRRGSRPGWQSRDSRADIAISCCLRSAGSRRRDMIRRPRSLHIGKPATWCRRTTAPGCSWASCCNTNRRIPCSAGRRHCAQIASRSRPPGMRCRTTTS